jgi:hypothetical protein
MSLDEVLQQLLPHQITIIKMSCISQNRHNTIITRVWSCREDDGADVAGAWQFQNVSHPQDARISLFLAALVDRYATARASIANLKLSRQSHD